jgi:hypothetical protein
MTVPFLDDSSGGLTQVGLVRGTFVQSVDLGVMRPAQGDEVVVGFGADAWPVDDVVQVDAVVVRADATARSTDLLVPLEVRLLPFTPGITALLHPFSFLPAGPHPFRRGGKLTAFSRLLVLVLRDSSSASTDASQ